jgi:hypothetical protein
MRRSARHCRRKRSAAAESMVLFTGSNSALPTGCNPNEDGSDA